jgi:hypothetical protein
MALKRKWIASPNYSSRGGSGVRLIVIHTAEGATTIESLGNFFASSSSGVSSHTGIDDKLGTIGEYVKRGNKAWTASNANPVAVQTELCAFAKWSHSEWQRHPNMLDNCARWIAEEAKAFGIPITKLSASQAQGSGRGVCQHADLGSWGGGHWDCGSGFPMDDVLAAAKRYASGEEETMGYPDWFWDWVSWYLTTDRSNDDRPDAAPDKIPQWAWDGEQEVERVGKRYGMTGPERDWIDWRAEGAPADDRPDSIPDKIPERWWDDNSFVIDRASQDSAAVASQTLLDPGDPASESDE